MSSITNTYSVFDDVLPYYDALLSDIKGADKSICIEIFRFDNGHISKRIISALKHAIRRGVDVKILVDAWGTMDFKAIFADLIAVGGSVHVWEKIKFSFSHRNFIKSHKRNHRKIIVIDNVITYIGSANITDYSLSWRELILRVSNKEFSSCMKRIFLKNFYLAKHKTERKSDIIKPLYAYNFEILRDVPSIVRSNIRKCYIELIENAKGSIVIETPYFLPSSSLRKALETALLKGVKVFIIIPFHSDVLMADVLRNRYLGYFHEKGALIKEYTPSNLHAKLLFIDQSSFVVGSSNFDYRSFRFQHEIVVVGKQRPVVKLLKNHVSGTLEECSDFDYERWKHRGKFAMFSEWLLLPIRHLF